MKMDTLSSGITKPTRQPRACTAAAHLCTSDRGGGQHLKVFNLQRGSLSSIHEHADSMQHA